jgi:nicotinamidase-related amidase
MPVGSANPDPTGEVRMMDTTTTAQATYVAGSIPYPWPYDGMLDPRRTALLICGAQAAIAAQCEGAPELLDRVLALACTVRVDGGTVVWLRHGSTSNDERRAGRAFLPARHSRGWKLTATPFPDDVVVDCSGWDGCFGSDLDNALRSRGIRTIAIGGFASEVTVDSTVRTLNDQGHECLVLTDCCAPLDEQLGARAHASVTMSGGIFGALGTSSAFAAALVAARDSQ